MSHGPISYVTVTGGQNPSQGQLEFELRAASGGRMVEGQEEDSEEEHDVLRTYMEIYDDNFDYDF